MHLNFPPKTKHIKSTVNISSWLIFRSILRLINHASFFSESNFRFNIAETGQRKKHQAIDHYGHPFPAKLADYVCPSTQKTRSVASFVFGEEVVNTFYYDNCHAAVRRTYCTARHTLNSHLYCVKSRNLFFMVRERWTSTQEENFVPF